MSSRQKVRIADRDVAEEILDVARKITIQNIKAKGLKAFEFDLDTETVSL